MAIAIDSGKATIATVSPAIASERKFRPEYPSRSVVTSFGVNRSTKPAEDG
jgi:hypothetical protein